MIEIQRLNRDHVLTRMGRGNVSGGTIHFGDPSGMITAQAHPW
jgi:hypothetical protein